MSVDRGPHRSRDDTNDPGPGWRDMYYCQTCRVWTDNPTLYHDTHFTLEPFTKTSHTAKPTGGINMATDHDLLLSREYNDLEDAFRSAKRRYEDAQYELAAQVSIRRAMNRGIHSGDDYWRAVSTENYLITRCLHLQQEVTAAKERLTKFDTDHLPNWQIEPVNIPQVEA